MSLHKTVFRWAKELKDKMGSVDVEEDITDHIKCLKCGYEDITDIQTEYYDGPNIMPGGYKEFYNRCPDCGTRQVQDLQEYRDNQF